MRLASFTWFSVLVFCAAGFGQAGKKDAKPADKEKKEITEVGGKSVEEWTHEFASKDPSKREHAMRMVMMFSANQAKHAVGPLLDELKKHNKPRPIDLSVRISGCVAIGTILSSIPPPKKDEKEDKSDLKHVEEAVKLLRSFCKDTQVIVRTRAVQALAQLARRYAPLVTPALDDVNHVANDYDTWEARQAGLETLTMLVMIKAYQDYEKDKDKAPPLPSSVWLTYQKRLDDNSQEVRLTALKSLAQFSQPPALLGKLAQSERGLLKHIETVAQYDPQPSIRIWGHLALMTLQHQIDKQRLQPIARIVDDPKQDMAIRIQAAQALGMVGGQLQALKKTKKEDKPKIEPKVGEGVDKFICDKLVLTLPRRDASLNDEDVNLATVSMNALAQTDPVYAVGPVVDMLGRKKLRAQAAKVLAAIGNQAEPGAKGAALRGKVFDAIQQTTLGNTDSEIVALGMNALAHADPLAAVDPVVGILLNNKEPALRAEAAKVLAVISVVLRDQKRPYRTRAEGDLIAKLKDQETTVVVNCINALVQMDSERAIPVLQEMSLDASQQAVVKDAARQAVKVIREQMNKKDTQPKGKVAAPR